MTSSLLHSTSAQAQRRNAASINSLEGLRLLLIEEESDIAHNDSGSPFNTPKLSFSLAMEAAIAVVASSNLVCRGCTKEVDKKSTDNDEGPSGLLECCRCTKVALLIPGKTKQSRKRRMQPSNSDKYVSSRILGAAGKLEFPLHCRRESSSSQTLPFIANNDDSKEWDENLLNQIHIKYVNSLSDLIRFLAYAPSLPDHLQPLDGIFLMGLGELLSREISTSGSIEMTHALSILSDTGDALEDNRRGMMQSDEIRSKNITLVATLCEQAFQSLPKQHLYQWMECTASIKNADDVPSPNLRDENELSSWALDFQALNDVDQTDKPSITSSLFKVVHSVNCDHESCQQIIWDA